jgi:sigma-B regulation protein RsbU (phosphoserine phosphatase)
MKFRTALLLGTLLFIATMATATVLAVSIIIDRAAQRAVVEDLHRSLDIFAEMQTYRRALLRFRAQILADEPRLKAVLATMDISAATVQGVARDLGRATEADLFVIIDADGVVLADLADPEAAGRDLSGHLLVAGALRHGEASGTWPHSRHVYQAHAVRIGFADEFIGVIILGYLINDHVAESIHGLTASTVAIQYKDALIAVWPPRPGGAADEWALSRAVATLPIRSSTPVLIELKGDRYLAVAARFPGQGNEAGLRFAVLQSLDRALAPGQRLQRVLFLTAAAALAVALLLAALLARRLTRPIDRLVSFTERVASGDLDARAEASQAGAVELASLARAMNHMMERIEESQRQIAAQERIAQELEIAARIQTSILPRQLVVPGFDVAAVMVTADEVGGDYYDVLVRDHTWIAIGDVAGHGVPAGLVMMMVQNVLSALIQAWPDAAPSAICAAANRVLVENVRQRLQRDEHVTLTLLRCDDSGRIVFAGAHEEILVWRARSRVCERISTPGTWLAVMRDIDSFLTDQELELAPGDAMVLYTDGVTEARDASGEQFGMERLCAAVEEVAGAPSQELCAHILQTVDTWASAREDDVTVVVVRRA